MAFNRFAAGKKVYGQGSYAPTRGPVDPKGYIKRELKRRAIKTNMVGSGPRVIAQPVKKDGSGPRVAAPIKVGGPGPRVPGNTNPPNAIADKQKAQRIQQRKFLASHPQHWKNNPGGKKWNNSTKKNRKIISRQGARGY